MDPVQTLALPSLAEDLARVEDSLHEAVSTPDRFLADVASHLIGAGGERIDRKSTRLNSSHLVISYAVFCLKKKISSKNSAGRIGCSIHDDHSCLILTRST